MDGSCGSVSLDAYWNTVAVPFLFIVLGFGLFVLFSLKSIHLGESVERAFSTIAQAQRPRSSSDDLGGNSFFDDGDGVDPDLFTRPGATAGKLSQ